MPRYRKLYVKILDSLDFNDMPDDFTRLFWALLPLVLCREGRGLNNAPWLKSKVFPLREDLTAEQVRAALDWLINRGMAVTYSVKGRDYFYIPTWHEHQGVTTKEAESDYPAPEPVKRRSRVSQELVKSKSVTDADADANADPDADATAAADGSTEVDPALAAGAGVGMDEKTVKKLVGEYGGDRFMAQIEYVKAQKGIDSPAGLVISRLRNGLDPPPPPQEDWHRFIQPGVQY